MNFAEALKSLLFVYSRISIIEIERIIELGTKVFFNFDKGFVFKIKLEMRFQAFLYLNQKLKMSILRKFRAQSEENQLERIVKSLNNSQKLLNITCCQN